MKSRDRTIPLKLVLRFFGAVFGGYVLTALTVAAMGAVMLRLGVARSDAVVLAAMLGFIVYLLLLLWAFSVRNVTRLWLAIAAGSAGMAALLSAVR